MTGVDAPETWGSRRCTKQGGPSDAITGGAEKEQTSSRRAVAELLWLGTEGELSSDGSR